MVLVIHGIDAWQPTRSGLVNRLVRKIDAYISVSEFTRQRFLDWAFPKSGPCVTRPSGSILPNCVDLAQFTPGPKNPALLERYGLHDRTVLLTVARLSADERYKGIDEVLEVLPELAKQIPNLSYLIVGDGTDRARLMAKARALGLRAAGPRDHETTDNKTTNPALPSSSGPVVMFTGRIPESEKVDHYRLADAFVMPGRGEGFGIVYLEALACGVPVVASKVDASQEIVARIGESIAVDPKNSDELCQAILQMLKNRNRGVAPKLAEFSWENFCRRCREILNAASHPEGKPCVEAPAPGSHTVTNR